jgi:hypothetical protein
VPRHLIDASVSRTRTGGDPIASWSQAGRDVATLVILPSLAACVGECVFDAKSGAAWLADRAFHATARRTR